MRCTRRFVQPTAAVVPRGAMLHGTRGARPGSTIVPVSRFTFDAVRSKSGLSLNGTLPSLIVPCDPSALRRYQLVTLTVVAFATDDSAPGGTPTTHLSLRGVLALHGHGLPKRVIRVTGISLTTPTPGVRFTSRTRHGHQPPPTYSLSTPVVRPPRSGHHISRRGG